MKRLIAIVLTVCMTFLCNFNLCFAEKAPDSDIKENVTASVENDKNAYLNYRNKFADNSEDTYRLLYEWPILAESVVKGILKYYQIPYKEPAEKTYIVKPNDSLYLIANKFNTSIASIKKRNNLLNDTIYPGATLYISW